MLRILNLDDNEAARYVKRRMLASAGHEVVDAACGAEGLALLDGGGVDVALIDMKLPDMSGFEVTRRIRNNPRTRNLPVIQLSAICVTPDDQRDGMVSGADAYLVPPVAREELLAMVGEVHRVRSAKTPVAVPAGLARNRLRKLDAYIREHLHEAPGVEQLASVVGLSPFYFTRMLKRATGLTPYAYLTHARLEEAVRMLEEGEASIAEIGARIGCRTAAHFSALFRRHNGVAPREYRRRCHLATSYQATEAMPAAAAMAMSAAPGASKRNIPAKGGR